MITAVLLAAFPVSAPAPAIATCDADAGELRLLLEGVEITASEKGFEARGLRGAAHGAASGNGAPSGNRPLSGNGAPSGNVAIGQDTQGRPFRLAFEDDWVLRRGDEEIGLPIPPQLSARGKVQVLGLSRRRVWFAVPGLIGAVDLDKATVSVSRIGRRADGVFPLVVGEEALVISDRDLWRCSSPSTCRRSGRLPIGVTAVLSGPRGWLFAGAGSSPGLYRALRNAPHGATLLVAGEVVVLCNASEGEAWAVVQREQEVRLVAASTETPAVRLFAPSEALSNAILTSPLVKSEVVLRILAAASRDQWPQLETLLLKTMRDETPEVRRATAAALSQVAGARSTAALWLLGRDQDAKVRMEALHASAARCLKLEEVACSHAMAIFIDDGETEIAWTARDTMLQYDPVTALDGAQVEYKLDAISSLIARLQRDGGRLALTALQLLASDSDPRVRATARMALAGMLP